MEFYLEMLDNIQAILDRNDPKIPNMILGDFNTNLPYGKLLKDGWYKSKPFFLTEWITL